MFLSVLSLGLLFFVLAGEGVAQQDDDSENTSLLSQFFRKKSNQPNQSSQPSQSTNQTKQSPINSFLPSSWFRKKPDESKTDLVKPETVDLNTARPASASALTPPREPNVSRPSDTLDDFSSNDLHVAPLPPEHPYYERNQVLAESNRANRQPVSISESVKLPAPDTVPDPRIAETDEPMIPNLASYSFDTRDWVESFPVEHVVGLDGYSSNQSTSLNVHHTRQKEQPESPAQIVTRNSPAPNQRQNTVSPNIPPKSLSSWDGQAAPIPVNNGNEKQSAKIASTGRFVFDGANGTKKHETVKPRIEVKNGSSIDLSPSYTSRLKYSEVYGVVVVQSNFPLTEIRTILEEIKQLQIDLNLYMGVSAPKEKIELCLFRDEKSYLKFLQEVFPKAPHDRRALYIKIDNKPGTLLVQKTDEFEIDLRHEMTHAIIHASITNVPIWLDEGLAKYFEVPINDRAERNPYMKQIRWNTQLGSVPALPRLEKLENINQMGLREYRDSWAWVHFLIHHSPQTHRLLAGYLQLLSTLPADQDSAKIPKLGSYLEDAVANPREKYRKHFQKPGTEKN